MLLVMLIKYLSCFFLNPYPVIRKAVQIHWSKSVGTLKKKKKKKTSSKFHNLQLILAQVCR